MAQPGMRSQIVLITPPGPFLAAQATNWGAVWDSGKLSISYGYTGGYNVTETSHTPEANEKYLNHIE